MSNKKYNSFNFFPILGFSGSNKSNLLNDLELIGEQVVSIEKLIGIDGACLAPLTKDKIFSTSIEELITQKLNSFDNSKIIYIEWKSPDVIGYPLPIDLIHKVRSSFSVVINEKFEQRVDNLLYKYSLWVDHLDLLLDKLDPLKNKNLKFPQHIFNSLKHTKDVKEFITILLNWLDLKYLSEIEKFSNVMYGSIVIKDGTSYLLGHN